MRRCFVLCALLLLAAGCQKVNQEKTVTVEPTDIVAPIIVDGPASEQSVILTVTPDGGAVDVFITTVANIDEFTKEPKVPASPIVSKQKVDKEETLTATIPAKKHYAVVLANATKAAKVKVKLTGK